MFVCKPFRNPDPEIDVIVINDSVAKPMNQDQDGDKNAVYALLKRTNNFYARDGVEIIKIRIGSSVQTEQNVDSYSEILV